MFKTLITLCTIGTAIVGCSPKKALQTDAIEKTDSMLTMLVGTYTSGISKGIYTFRFNENSGEAIPLSETEASNPSYLTLSEDGKFVYSVDESDQKPSAANAFAFDKEKGTLRLLNSQKTNGKAPCYIISNGKYAITANYGGGSISIFPINEKDGSLLPASQVIKFEGKSVDKERQSQPHLHCVRITPDGKYLLADDLGTDKIHKFKINPNANAENKEDFLIKGDPESFNVEPYSGPRHLIFSADGKYAYLITEISGMVIVFEYNDGNLKEIQSIPADNLKAEGSGDIHISPDGKFLYASNRLRGDGLAIFRINPKDGMLTKLDYQFTKTHPRNFIITPNGKFILVACRDSNVIQVFKRNLETGLLTNVNKNIIVDKPVCIKFAP